MQMFLQSFENLSKQYSITLESRLTFPTPATGNPLGSGRGMITFTKLPEEKNENKITGPNFKSL